MTEVINKKLVEILNNEKDNWRKPRWFEDVQKFSYDRVWEISFLWWKWVDNKPFWRDRSFHDLFSKDSWLLDFIEWKWSLYDILFVNWYCDNWKINIIKQLWWWYAEYHYMIMWWLTEEEK